MTELIALALTVIAALAGFAMEWRRSGRERSDHDALASRVADNERRLALIEARHDRIDRAR